MILRKKQLKSSHVITTQELYGAFSNIKQNNLLSWFHSFEVFFLSIDEALEAKPFGGMPFGASCIENEEVIAVVGNSYLY